MKRTPLKRQGKRGRMWANAKRKLKKEYQDKGITTCEIRLPGCYINKFLAFAHRLKRRHYRTEEELGSYNETLLACQSCHEKIEYDRQLSSNVFGRLR